MATYYAGFAFAVSGSLDLRYTSDYGSRHILNTRFVVPLGLTLSTGRMSAIADLMNAHATYVTGPDGREDITSISNVCTEASNIVPRKYEIIFDSGASTRIAVGEAESGLIAARAIGAELRDAGAGEVVCINLIGEYFKNMNDFTTPAVTFSPTASATRAGYGKYYSGKIDYTRDDDTVAQTSVKVKVEDDTAPPNFLSGSWDSCVGDFIGKGFSCPGSGSKLKHRRLIVNYQVDSSTREIETRELPVKSLDDVATCANGLASGTEALLCLQYRGESRKNLPLS